MIDRLLMVETANSHRVKAAVDAAVVAGPCIKSAERQVLEVHPHAAAKKSDDRYRAQRWSFRRNRAASLNQPTAFDRFTVR